MKKPLKKDFAKPFDGNLVMFDSKGYSNALEKYIEYIENELDWVFDRLLAIPTETGHDYGDAGDQAVQTLEKILKPHTDEELFDFAKNSNTTYQSCGGHAKAYRNKNRRDYYLTRLSIRTGKIYDVLELPKGTMNGPGSV